MSYKIFFFTFLMSVVIPIFSQEGNKMIEKNGELFYSTVEKTDTVYNITLEIFELKKIKYIELELYNSEEVKLISNTAILKLKNKKVLMTYNENKSEVSIYDINLALKNIDNSINYPKIIIKLLDQNYKVIDYSQKTFY